MHHAGRVRAGTRTRTRGNLPRRSRSAPRQRLFLAKAVAGVDGVTWQEYGEDLERKLADLHAHIHRGAYRAQPSRRHYIPKPDGRQRPLGIAALEDKIVQRAME